MLFVCTVISGGSRESMLSLPGRAGSALGCSPGRAGSMQAAELQGNCQGLVGAAAAAAFHQGRDANQQLKHREERHW